VGYPVFRSAFLKVIISVAMHIKGTGSLEKSLISAAGHA
jgi:hypothetical protein